MVFRRKALAMEQVRCSSASILNQSNYHRLEVRLPRAWLSLVEQIAWNYEEEPVDSVMGTTIRAATQAVIQSTSGLCHQGEALRIALGDLDGPDTTISPDLLSPIPTRDPSPRRLRPKSKSPARWKILRSIRDAIQDVINHRNPGIYGTSFDRLSLGTSLNTNVYFQFRYLTTHDQDASCAIWTSITSGQLACVARLKKASVAGL
jgi:hypothetical protein